MKASSTPPRPRRRWSTSPAICSAWAANGCGGREDMACLAAFARSEKWPKQLTQFLKTFLRDFGVGDGDEAS